MEHQNNSGSQDTTIKETAGKSKMVYYRNVCIVLCLHITVAVFGGCAFLRDGKEDIKINRDFSEMGEGKNEAVPVLGQADSISVEITAESAIVINADTNTVLYQKQSTDKIAPASTAKLIMALTALDYCSPEDEVTVGAEIEMIHKDSSRAWLTKGDVLTVRQLLIALLLPSGNDAAYTLAVNAGKKITGNNSLTNGQSIDVFLDKANEKARALGAASSNFTAPDGYPAEGQYSTAYDLAMIAKACLDNPTISKIVASYTSYEKWANGREVTYNNTNELLNPNSLYYRPEVIGLKTGTSSLSGACLISAAVINGKTYICSVMGADGDGRFQDSIAIYDEIKARVK